MQEMPYLHSYLLLNNKSISLSVIQKGEVKSSTPFEEATLTFLHQWLNGKDEFVLQTSGSTGTPKTITVTRAQLKASATATLQALAIQENATALICLPTHYIAGIMMLVRCLVGNLSMAICEPSANPISNFPSTTTFDFAAIVPYQVTEILNKNGLAGIQRIKNLLIGGAPLASAIKEKLIEASTAVYLTYGMTETLSHIALQRISGVARESFFTALPSITLSQDERGCLVIQLPFLDEIVKTNDLIEFRTPNTFYWLGRWDNVINSGGLKLIPEKIEEAIQSAFQNIGIKYHFFIAGIPDEKLGTKAVLVIESMTPVNEELLKNQLKNTLKNNEIPKHIYYLNTFEHTPTGKVKRTETLQKLGL